MKIGIFDSGIGGLTIYRAIKKQIPRIDAYYYSDAQFAPYGDKVDSQIIERCYYIVEKFLENGVQLIVIACNTATAVAIDILREKYPIPFVGVEPYINYLNHHADQKINAVVLLTETTAKSNRFAVLKKRLDPEQKIEVFPCPNLAQAIEKGQVTDEFLKNELAPILDKGFSTVILGCTHYPFVQELISRLLQATCVSPCEAVAKRVFSLLSGENEGEGQLVFIGQENSQLPSLVEQLLAEDFVHFGGKNKITFN